MLILLIVYRLKGSRFKVQGSGFRVQRFRVQRFRVQRFRVQRFRVQRFRVQNSKVTTELIQIRSTRHTPLGKTAL